MLKCIKKRIKKLLSIDGTGRYKASFRHGPLYPTYYIYINAKNHFDAYTKLSLDERKIVRHIEDECGNVKNVDEILQKNVLIKFKYW
jgi:hypothetical protein